MLCVKLPRRRQSVPEEPAPVTLPDRIGLDEQIGELDGRRQRHKPVEAEDSVAGFHDEERVDSDLVGDTVSASRQSSTKAAS